MLDNAGDSVLEGLNTKQREAVQCTEGPLLVIAGAGSGKTKTLTHRIAYILLDHLATEQDVLAVTFTNKAAGEMRERLATLLHQPNYRSFMPWMGTFHSIAVKLLRLYGEAINVPTNFVIFDEADKMTLIRNIMKDFAISDKQFTPKAIASAISNSKNAGDSLEDYNKKANNPYWRTIYEVYRRYEEQRRKQRALDFDDLLVEAHRLLHDSPEVRKRLQEQFKYILVDEYQDTNHLQYRIIKLLLNGKNNICVVGDDWQSIYSWRGADFTNILNFSQDFAGAKVVKLEQNYRSTGNILNAAHNVIVKNTQRSDKQLWTKAGDGEPVQFIEAYNELNEAETIGLQIQTAHAVGARQYNDFAILYRTNAQSRAFEQMFRKLALPYKIIGGLRFYDRAEIKDLLAYLRIVYQPYDEVSFRRVVNVPKRGLGEVSVDRFLEWRAQTDCSVVDALRQVDLCNDLTPRARKELQTLGELFSKLAEQATVVTPDQLLTDLIEATKYREYLDDGTDQGRAKVENVEELVSDAKQYGDLVSFLEEVALVSGADDTNHDHAVNLMTMHAAKGLEFPVVYLVGMEDGLFPSARDLLTDSALEEARRLCYVGMTRAKDELTLSYARSRMMNGRVQYNMPSQFLSDIKGEPVRPANNNYDNYGQYDDYRHVNDNTGWAIRRPVDSQEPHYEYEDASLSIGDRVRHQMFGDGTVLAVNGSTVKVRFASRIRSINLEYAPLVKIS